MKSIWAGAALSLALPAAVAAQGNDEIGNEDLARCAAIYGVVAEHSEAGSETATRMFYRFQEFYLLLTLVADANPDDDWTAEKARLSVKAEVDRVREIVEAFLAKGESIKLMNTHVADCDIIRRDRPEAFALVDKRIGESQQAN